jgi:hypothetical protein
MEPRCLRFAAQPQLKTGCRMPNFYGGASVIWNMPTRDPKRTWVSHMEALSDVGVFIDYVITWTLALYT